MQPRPKRSRKEEPPSPGRIGLRALLRQPAIQLLLCAVAGVQTLAVHAEAGPRAEPAKVLRPLVVTPHASEGLIAFGGPQAVERESQRLAAKYRAEGYPVPLELARTISRAAVDNQIDPEIAFGLVRAESSFRNSATSRVGAVGLTQLMPATARWMEPGTTGGELRDPETNVRIGLKYLRYLIDKYGGNERLALVAYNRGPGTVDRALKRGRNPDNGYADFVYGKEDHGHRLFTE